MSPMCLSTPCASIPKTSILSAMLSDLADFQPVQYIFQVLGGHKLWDEVFVLAQDLVRHVRSLKVLSDYIYLHMNDFNVFQMAS